MRSRARAYEATVDALFFTGVKASGELEAIAAATRLPIAGRAPEEMSEPAYLAGQRGADRPARPCAFAAATLAVYETLKALREGQSPRP
jgi:carboxyvinyl-carboxyphosphonate phosphorylmutase